MTIARTRGERTGQAGFSIAETLLVVGIIGLLTIGATPMFLRYYQGAQLTLGAQEVVTFLNNGRQLAITQNANVCVHISSTSMHYHLGSCAGGVWLGPGTDSVGNIPVPAGISLSTTADPVFSYLGAAAPAATYTITNTQTAATVHVIVASSGRITVGP
jgi:Tfp pilus assembly protein FimT